MTLMDNFRIALLMGLVCTIGIVPSTALKCHQGNKLGVTPDVECPPMLENPTCKLSGDLAGTAIGCVYGGYCDTNETEFHCSVDVRQSLVCCCTTDNCNSGREDGPKHAELCEFKKAGVEELYPDMKCPQTEEEKIEEEKNKKELEELKKEKCPGGLVDALKCAGEDIKEDKAGLDKLASGATGPLQSYCVGGGFPLVMLVAVSTYSFLLKPFF